MSALYSDNGAYKHTVNPKSTSDNLTDYKRIRITHCTFTYYTNTSSKPHMRRHIIHMHFR